MMAARLFTLTLAVFLCLCLAGMAPPSHAQQWDEEIESDISARDIAIESNFTGSRIVVFGTIENSQQTEFKRGFYDVVVVISGPEETVVTWRKSRVFGIWINTDSRTFTNAPGYYAVLSTRPLEKIASPAILNAYGFGFDTIKLQPLPGSVEPGAENISDFRQAFFRIKQREGLYQSDTEGVQFVGRSLFRATVNLPANVPVGRYASDVYLLRNGKVLSHNRSYLTIHKQGFERIVYTAAFDHPLIYGFAAVIIAILAGLLASAATRRE